MLVMCVSGNDWANEVTVQMIQIMQRMGEEEQHGSEVAKTRAGILSQYLK